MFGISGTELFIILFFGFLIFGPEKLPQIGRTVGRAIRQFRTASEAANKKFKEEVADPFSQAVAPYKDQVEQSTKPLQEDLAAINDTLNETKNMFTDPFKDILSPTTPKTSKSTPAVISAGTAVDEAKPVAAQDATKASTPVEPTDPFADVLPQTEDAPVSDTKPEGKPIPKTGGTVKKSMAASLYDLDDEDGE